MVLRHKNLIISHAGFKYPNLTSPRLQPPRGLALRKLKITVRTLIS